MSRSRANIRSVEEGGPAYVRREMCWLLPIHARSVARPTARNLTTRIVGARATRRCIERSVLHFIVSAAPDLTGPLPSNPPPLSPQKPQTARVQVINEGVIPTTFKVVGETTSKPPKAVTGSTATPAAASAAEKSITPAPASGERRGRVEGEGEHPTQAAVGNDEERRSEREPGAASGLRSSGTILTEEGLLEKACAAGDAGTKYPEGVGALEVEGGGELAGYGSSEILVTFAPLNVGEFRVVKVCLCGAVQVFSRERWVYSQPTNHPFSPTISSLGGEGSKWLAPPPDKLWAVVAAVIVTRRSTVCFQTYRGAGLGVDGTYGDVVCLITDEP